MYEIVGLEAVWLTKNWKINKLQLIFFNIILDKVLELVAWANSGFVVYFRNI
jgi:hypothetical protein